MLFVLSLTSCLFAGAIFGFFYAWVCSTMWGPYAAGAEVAIPAMQAMNASVRKALFFPAFFLTPVILALAALAARRTARPAAICFAAGAAVYAGGGPMLTVLVNVPMNEVLALRALPDDPAEAAAIWSASSPRWQLWNQARTVFSGMALLLAAAGTWLAGAARREPR